MDKLKNTFEEHKTGILIAGGIVGGFIFGVAAGYFGPKIVRHLSSISRTATIAATEAVTTTAPIVEIGAESIAEATIEAASAVV